ncbi:retrotransposon protein, putative, ty1-copia subclass, partial [Tanacetum coccineum]
KNKLAYAPNAKIPPPPKRDNLEKVFICHHCKVVGHWRRNCPSYHVELKKRKNASTTSTLGIFTIELYAFPNKTWVYDTVFQNEVKNQLGKKIKDIRSDRGGEYLSYGFVNHMKSYGIVSQLTSPYTPRHNRVSERKNHTLLDMVRSMMNLTTLPKSFWGYTLETAARILNMVPTKKVDRTPYEIWIPQVLDRYGYYVDIEEYELGDFDEPPNYKDVLVDPKSKKWLEAMNTEMQSMKDNQVWYLVDLLCNGRTVGCKWLFKKKTDMDGNVLTLKLVMWQKALPKPME